MRGKKGMTEIKEPEDTLDFIDVFQNSFDGLQKQINKKIEKLKNNPALKFEISAEELVLKSKIELITSMNEDSPLYKYVYVFILLIKFEDLINNVGVPGVFVPITRSNVIRLIKNNLKEITGLEVEQLKNLAYYDGSTLSEIHLMNLLAQNVKESYYFKEFREVFFLFYIESDMMRDLINFIGIQVKEGNFK